MRFDESAALQLLGGRRLSSRARHRCGKTSPSRWACSLLRAGRYADAAAHIDVLRDEEPAIARRLRCSVYAAGTVHRHGLRPSPPSASTR